MNWKLGVIGIGCGFGKAVFGLFDCRGDFGGWLGYNRELNEWNMNIDLSPRSGFE